MGAKFNSLILMEMQLDRIEIMSIPGLAPSAASPALQVILLQVEDDHVAEYVNGELELEHVERFEIDMEKRTYRDDSGEGRFEDAEDIQEIDGQVAKLFASASRATLLKPKRARTLSLVP